jgi:integrase
MKFHVISKKTSTGAHSPIQVVQQSTGKGVAWINRYLDREYVRRLADKSLYSYAHSLLHFVRWWESVHHTGEISAADLTESTLFDYVRFQSSLRPPPSASTINDRTAAADRAIRNQFPDAPCQVAHGFHQPFLHRRPMGLGRPRFELSRLRVREPRLNVVPLSVDEVARFWSSFRNARDLAIVGLMLMQGLRSAEVMALNRDDVLLSEGQLRVRGKGNKLRLLPLAPETTQLLDHYLRVERPDPCSAALFVVLKGPARGQRMTPAGLRSLFRHHRRTTGVQLANPHRFRHTFASDMVRAGISLPALMQLMGHANIETTMHYVKVSPQDVYLQYARASILNRGSSDALAPPTASASPGAGLRARDRVSVHSTHSFQQAQLRHRGAQLPRLSRNETTEDYSSRTTAPRSSYPRMDGAPARPKPSSGHGNLHRPTLRAAHHLP